MTDDPENTDDTPDVDLADPVVGAEPPEGPARELVAWAASN